MTIAPQNGHNSTKSWPEGAIEDWQHGASYGWLSTKYGKSYTAVTELVRRTKALGKDRVVETTGTRRGGGTQKYTDQKPCSPIHRTIGLKIQDARGYGDEQISYKALGDKLRVSHLTARKMELGIHDFSLGELQRIAELRGETVAALMEPIKVRSNDRQATADVLGRGKGPSRGS